MPAETQGERRRRDRAEAKAARVQECVASVLALSRDAGQPTAARTQAARFLMTFSAHQKASAKDLGRCETWLKSIADRATDQKTPAPAA